MATGDAPAWVPEWAREAVAAILASNAFTWLLAAVVVFGSWYAGRVAVRVFGRRIARRFERPSVSQTVLHLIRTVIFAVGLLWALSILGIPLTGLALSVTVFSAMLGIVLAPIVGSIINGLFVLADQPYEIGDMVEFADTQRQGFIEDITLRYTKIFTLDNTFLVIPNSTIRERDIVNYSAEDERVRLSLSTTVTYEGDVDEARRLMESAARGVDTVIDGGPDIRIGSARYPAKPTCYIDEFGDHGITLTLRYWSRQPYKLLSVRSQVQERVWSAFEEAESVEIAYPHSHLFFDETSGEARVDVRDTAHARRERRRRERPGRENERAEPGDDSPEP